MYTYVLPGCKKVNTTTYVHTGGVSNAYSRVRMAWFVYMVGLERRNNVVVVFMGRQRNASCSWGGNGMCRVHREATECVGANRLGWNNQSKQGLAYHRTEETALCSTGHVRNGILLIRRGLAYHKTEETDLLRSKRGSC